MSLFSAQPLGTEKQQGAVPKKYSHAHIKQVAGQFEAMFASYMMKVMNESIPRSGFVKYGLGESVFTDMLNDKYAQKLSQSGSLGLADLMYKSMVQGGPGQVDSYENKIRDFRKSRHLSYDMLKNTRGNFGVADAYRKAPDDTDLRMSRLDALVNLAGQKQGVDPSLVKAVIRQESGGDRFAVSKKGAKGLMQLIDSTAKSLGVRQVYSPTDNIDGGTRYLRQLLDRFKGNQELALAAYNAGPTAVQKYGGIPPYPETQTYVKKVMAYFSAYKKGEDHE